MDLRLGMRQRSGFCSGGPVTDDGAHRVAQGLKFANDTGPEIASGSGDNNRSRVGCIDIVT